MFCEVADEAALRDACADLERAGVRFTSFHEPDRNGELTAIATAPVYGRRGRAPLRAFQLLQDPCAAPRPPRTAAGLARAQPGGFSMTAEPTTTVFRTRFGMFVPCDRETYRKLKRVRHLAAFAEAERRRWGRAQRRLPQNRTFPRRRDGRRVRELVRPGRMIFGPFYALAPAGPEARLPANARLATGTEMLSRFFADYDAARHPVTTAEEVGPMRLSAAEIDELLERIEVWNLRR